MKPGVIEADVRAFLVDTFAFVAEDEPIARDESLVDAGIIDSTGVLELVDFLEERYGVRIADDELLPENLDSLERIGAFVAAKAGRDAA